MTKTVASVALTSLVAGSFAWAGAGCPAEDSENCIAWVGKVCGYDK
ncbi:MAG: hypothetical protein ACM3VT_14245 [Solirubrobacterales bacterium]